MTPSAISTSLCRSARAISGSDLPRRSSGAEAPSDHLLPMPMLEIMRRGSARRAGGCWRRDGDAGVVVLLELVAQACGSRCRGWSRHGSGCPQVWPSVSMIRSRSTSARVRPTGGRGRAAAGRHSPPARAMLQRPASARRDDRPATMSAALIASPLASSTARCMQLSSSRTLPRQACASQRAPTLRARAAGPAGRWRRYAGARRSWRAAAISARRSRSGGKCRVRTLSRK